MLARTLFRLVEMRVLVALVLVCAGCGESDGLQRVAMFGKVTLDGSPLASGSISLLPSAGNNAPSANATIQQGEYRFDRENGPTAGEYQVLVMRGGVDNPSSKTASFEPRGPQRQEWTLSVQVPSTKDFEHNIPLETAAPNRK